MEPKHYLFDTNILLYAMASPVIWESKLKKFKDGEWHISIITHFEVLMGAVKQGFDLNELTQALEPFQVMIFQENVSFSSVQMLKKKSSLKFKDLIIATTAQQYEMELVTADHDFKSIPGLKVHLLK